MDLQTQLHNIATLTFEQLGFMFPMPELAEQYETAGFEGAAGVSFHGPVNGRLVIATYGELLPALAANMLGEESAPEEHRQDALGEITNVVCGNILPKIGGPLALFGIGAPKPMAADAVSRREGEEIAAKVELPLEGGRAEVSLFMAE